MDRLAAGRWFSPGTLVSSTNKTDCHNITKILLKVALNTISLTLTTGEDVKANMYRTASINLLFITTNMVLTYHWRRQ
jgi:hypothetical protein